MYVEKFFHVLVQLWSLGTGVSTNTFPRSGGCQHGRGAKTVHAAEMLSKNTWLGHALIIFLHVHGQVCGQKSSRDVVGLIQSSWALLQQTVWFGVSFFPRKATVKRKHSPCSTSAVPVCSDESLEHRLRPASSAPKTDAQTCWIVESVSH